MYIEYIIVNGDINYEPDFGFVSVVSQTMLMPFSKRKPSECVWMIPGTFEV